MNKFEEKLRYKESDLLSRIRLLVDEWRDGKNTWRSGETDPKNPAMILEDIHQKYEELLQWIENNKPVIDLYFLRSEEDNNGFYLVTKKFWDENHYVDDRHFGKEIWEILPRWNGTDSGFSEDAESYFSYHEGANWDESPKWLEIIQSMGIKEVFM